jgi:DNA-binding transcriptional MerR regulator
MTRKAAGRPTKKIFHKIGEVCELTKTEPYVLRYWESEFPFLAPEKNRAGQRIYSDDDIQMVLAIKRLLYEEGYTTAGARRRLEKELQEGRVDAGGEVRPEGSPAPSAPAQPSLAPVPAEAASGEATDLRAALARIRAELRDLRDALDPKRPGR